MERLSMHCIQDILYRLRKGQPERSIARDLGHSRDAIRRYHRLARQKGYLDPNRPLPEAAELQATLGPSPTPPCPASTVEPYRTLVEGWLAQGLEMVAVHRRLTDHHGFTGSYAAVRRFVKRLHPGEKRVVLRMETPPGRQAQVDFGSAGKIRDPQTGKERTAYCFVMTLSYSRHQYLEFVFDQSIPTWIRCHRNAFESFGGAPEELVIDNLKAAILHAALEDSVLSAPYRQMARHYGCLIHPCRPRTPQHKGKVENGVHYVKRNFLAGELFFDLHDANRRGRGWVREVAGVRDHGTTHEAPLLRFETQEKTALLPLPAESFHLLSIRAAKVHADCHVTVEGSFYSAPHTHVGKVVEVHLYEGTVQLFDGITLLVTHSRAQKRGARVTRVEHYPAHKALYLERTPSICRERAQQIGPACAQVAERLLSERPVDQLPAVQKLIGLQAMYGAERLEAACARALHFGDPRYRRVKGILKAGLEHDPLPEGVEALVEALPGDPSTEETRGRPEGKQTQTAPSYTYARSAQEFFPPELFCEIEPLDALWESRTC